MEEVKEQNVPEVQEVDYKVLYIHTLADYQNLQKRTSKDIREAAIRTGYKVLNSFIPVYHDVKRALKYGDEGAKIIYNKFVQVMMQNGIGIVDQKFFDSKEMKFNSDYATAISTTPTEDPELDGFVADVVEDGFYDINNSQAVSYAKVVVYKYSK